MTETRIWKDIERIANATNKHLDDVYSELMVDFGILVVRKAKKVIQ